MQLLKMQADTCGTLALAAESLKAKGALEIYAFCSHGVLSGNAIEKLEASPLKELVITNSIAPSEKAKKSTKVKFVDISEMMAEAIRRTHDGESISDLFNDKS